MAGTLTVTGSLSSPVVVVLRQPAGAADGPAQPPTAFSTKARKPVVFRIRLRNVYVPLALVRVEPA